MARVTTVKKAQKDQGNCEKCGTPIKVGDGYKWCAPRAHRAARGFKRRRCLACPTWQPSEMTSSPGLSALYSATEDAYDRLAKWEASDGIEALEEILTNCAEGIREAAQVYEESAANMVDGFGHETVMSEEIQEKADTLNGQADEVEAAANDLQDWEADEEPNRWFPMSDGQQAMEDDEDGFETEEEAQAWIDEQIDGGEAPEQFTIEHRYVEGDGEPDEEWADEQRQVVEDALGNVGI